MDLNGVVVSAVIVVLFHNDLMVALLYISCIVVYMKGTQTPWCTKA